MCGRFSRTVDGEQIAEVFAVEQIDASVSRSFNIAPTQTVAAIVQDDQRRLVAMRWGLIPSWADRKSVV